METPGIGHSVFTIKFDENWLTPKNIINPPILICDKPCFYSDLIDRQIYVGWIEDGRYRRFGIDTETLDFIIRKYKEYKLI